MLQQWDSLALARAADAVFTAMAATLRNDPAAAHALTELSLYPARPDCPIVQHLLAPSVNHSFVTLFEQHEQSTGDGGAPEVGLFRCPTLTLTK
jgi:hypothetical protein